MTDISWISHQAQQIHGVFMSLFYVLITVLLCLGVFIEYFKWPLGGVPSFSTLVGRTLIAALLLNTYPQVSNTVAELSDALSRQLGDVNQFKVVLSHMGDQLKTLTFSWVSVRDTLTMVISFISFFLLYFSVHVVEAFLMYAWTLLYVFSPVLIALFVLPSTSSATKALYRTLIEMSCWKIVWSVLATLLWSTALSEINKPNHDINFITSICYNLILAGSVLLTPMIVHSLASSGLSGMAQSVGAIAVGAATFSPGKVASTVEKGLKSGKTAANHASEHIKSKYFSKNKPAFKPSSPPFQKGPNPSSFHHPQKQGHKKSNTQTSSLKNRTPPPPHTDKDAPRTETTLSEI